jgi:RimJ/RimL family protein N-acetyltransferase
MAGGVRLREVRASDLPFFFEFQRDPEATAMAALPARDRETFDEHWTRILEERAVSVRTIVVADEVVGNVVSFDRLGEREVGYWIGREHWGKGIATMALAEFLRHERTRPLLARVAVHNGASIRVLEKCGFAVVAERDDGNLGDGVEEVVMKLV